MANLEFNITERPVNPGLFDGIAENIAASFVGKDSFDKPFGVARNQIRRLYDEVKRFEQNLDGNQDTWNKYVPYIRMIKSKLSYNITRAIEKSKISAGCYKKLSDFITKGIDQVKNEEDYHIFAALFEAVYGFYYENSQGIKEN
jgi:CRISPR-associated protein Csm2